MSLLPILLQVPGHLAQTSPVVALACQWEFLNSFHLEGLNINKVVGDLL